MDNISFKSNIRMIPHQEFSKIAGRIGGKKSVNYPWTIKQSVLADSAYTTDIFDCTVCGITDGQKVLLNHLCPSISDNFNFSKITDFIKNNIDTTNQYLQGFILGSKSKSLTSSSQSELLFDRVINFMKEMKIPYSAFKGGTFTNNVAYSSLNDEWVISNNSINETLTKEFSKNPAEIFKIIFDDISVSELDEIKI